MDIPFAKEDKDGIKIKIKLTPNASKSGFAGVFTDADGAVYLKASVRAAPADGKANEELCGVLAKLLHIGKTSVTVISGHTDRRKALLVQNADEAVKEKLCKILS